MTKIKKAVLPFHFIAFNHSFHVKFSLFSIQNTSLMLRIVLLSHTFHHFPFDAADDFLEYQYDRFQNLLKTSLALFVTEKLILQICDLPVQNSTFSFINF